MSRTGRSPRRLCPWTVDSFLLAGLILGTLVHPSGAVIATASGDPHVHPSTSASSIGFAVDPASFWMRTGSNVTLVAVWTSATPPCRAEPLWYRWSLGDGAATGFLNNSQGSSATFFADSYQSGMSNVTVRSLSVVVCDGNETTVERTAVAKISVDVPLVVSDVELSPNPLLPGENSTMKGTIAGGEPPYTLEFSWGDGTTSEFNRPIPGTFSASHRFPSGNFLPSVLVSDSEGIVVNSSVAEVVSVGDGLEVAIDPSSYETDVGKTVQFEGVVNDPATNEVSLFDCSNSTNGGGSTGANSSGEFPFSCTFNSPGTQEVLFGVYPTQPGGPSASVVLYERVASPPTVSAVAVNESVVAGGNSEIRVQVSGGVPPLSLAWNLSENQSGGEEALPADGDGVVTFSLPASGAFAVGVRATDAVGEIAEDEPTVDLDVDTSLAANASGSSVVRSVAFVGVGGAVISGCSPFVWWVVPGFVPLNGSEGSGVLLQAAGFAWNASFSREGNLSIAVGAVDACGAAWQTTLEVVLIPTLIAAVNVGAGPASLNESLAVNLSVRGGAPPFRFELNASDGESWNRTLGSDGSYHWLFPTDGNGSIGVSISVVDRLGISFVFGTTVNLTRPPVSSVPPSTPPPTPPPVPAGDSAAPPPSDPFWLLALLLLLAGGAAVLILLRRRRTKEALRDGPAPDPVTTLKRIVQPAEGAERFTVELLAEEAGIPMTVVRTTIDRLVHEGKLHSETGADGEEVLSWASESGQ